MTVTFHHPMLGWALCTPSEPLPPHCSAILPAIPHRQLLLKNENPETSLHILDYFFRYTMDIYLIDRKTKATFNGDLPQAVTENLQVTTHTDALCSVPGQRAWVCAVGNEPGWAACSAHQQCWLLCKRSAA